MNLGQLRTELQTKGYGTDTATAQTSMLNSVYRRIAGRHRWPWLEKENVALSTTASDPDYSLSTITDLLHIDAVRIEFGTSYPKIEYMEPQDFSDLEHEDRVNGEPIFWTYMNSELRLWPTPDKAYSLTIDYIRRPTDLSLDADEPAFDAIYHDILVWGAAAQMAYRERDWSAKNFADAEYDQRFREMERAYGVKQRQNSSRVKRSDFWGNVAMRSGYGGW